MRPRPSRLHGRVRIGADFFARRGAVVAVEPAPRGVVDRMAELANPGLDPARVHPAIVPFFTDAVGLELLVRSHWRFPLSLGWRLVRWILRWIGQFVLPVREGRIVTRAVGLDAARDGRPGARGIIRAYAGRDDVMQVVAYATWERAGTRYMSAAFPIPGGQILGILRLDAIGDDGAGRLAVELTSRRRAGDDAGVRLVLGGLALPSPFGERIALWAPGMACAPAAIDPAALPGATIIGQHDQRLFGIRFVTHHYWFRPVPDREPPPRT